MRYESKCPLCGNDRGISKGKMLCAILKKIGYKPEPSPYCDGQMNRWQMLAVYNYVVKGKRGR